MEDYDSAMMQLSVATPQQTVSRNGKSADIRAGYVCDGGTWQLGPNTSQPNYTSGTNYEEKVYQESFTPCE